MHAKSEILNCIKSQQNTVNNESEATLAFTESDKIRAKIDENRHVFWDIDFVWILEGFWEGFGRQKSTIFVIFSIKNASQK